MSFLFGELYVITFYFDLGDEYYIEQIREVPSNGCSCEKSKMVEYSVGDSDDDAVIQF